MAQKKRVFFFLMALVLIALGVSASFLFKWKTFTPAAAKLYPGRIVIGLEMWPGYLALMIADQKNYFKEAGLDVEIKRYPGLGELSKDYVAGKMQGRANLTLDAVNEWLSGLDHRIMLAIDYSNGSDAIVAKKEIQTVKDFQGKRVAYEPNTLEEFLISWALQENELNLSDIVSVAAIPEEALRQLGEGNVEVAVSHEPFMSQFLLAEENFHLVYSSADAPGLITDVLTFRKDFVDAHPETIQAICNVYFKALKFWKENPDEAHAIVAAEFGDSPQSIARQLQGISMLNERDNKTAFTFSAGLSSLYGNLRQIGEFVQTHRQIEPEKFLNTDTLIDRHFIANLEHD